MSGTGDREVVGELSEEEDTAGLIVTDTHASTVIDRELGLTMLERMLTIRAFEEQANDLYRAAKMPGLTHLYAGQEAVAVGVCFALRRDDTITSTHRGHGHCLAKGAEAKRMFCELLGKEEGYCRGKGGSMHIADHSNGNLGANAIVGGSAGIATGAALAAKRLGSGGVSVCFFGEGALGQGLLYEVMNMASLWKLPVIYVCENNSYNEYTPWREVTAGSITDRARAFEIPAHEIDGQDVLAVYAATQSAITHARAGHGPSFLVCATYRYYGHHVGDVDRAYYRSRDEEEVWRAERDPIRLLAGRLDASDELQRLDTKVRDEIAQSAQYAVEAPYPEPTEVTEDVFA
jgi:pyruvate dehydrogenase E1 component alpha subunit